MPARNICAVEVDKENRTSIFNFFTRCKQLGQNPHKLPIPRLAINCEDILQCSGVIVPVFEANADEGIIVHV